MVRPVDERLASGQEELAHIAPRNAHDLPIARREGLWRRLRSLVPSGFFRSGICGRRGNLGACSGIESCEATAPGLAAFVPELGELVGPEDGLDGAQAFGGKPEPVPLGAEGERGVPLEDEERDGGAEEGARE